RDPDLGKVVLYQLSYFRIMFRFREAPFRFASAKLMLFSHSRKFFFKKIKNRHEKYFSQYFFMSETGSADVILL
ncbi:MAG: hypothetical protein Q4C37_06185, partial [Bacteroidales bacterium]|nr:hypothetical protein [Bacteroidales bacterium]